MSGKKILVKLLILGDSGVGKTSIMNQYVDQRFSNQYKATIGADFSTKEIIIDSKTYILQIWDTAGQERFQSLSIAFYRGADCCALVFDVNNKESFNNLGIWHKEFLIQTNVDETIAKFPFVVIGNKMDKNERHVSKSLVIPYGKYFECSAKTGLNIDESILYVVKSALDREKIIKKPDLYQLDIDHINIESKKKCC